MTAYKKTMREALQEVSSFKVKKEEKENQSFIGPEPLPDFDDEGEEINTTPHEVELDEDGHADVASAIRQCKTVMEDAQQIMAKLQTMSPEDSLPTWWTNKFAVASNSMNKMRDYIVNPLGEALDKEDEPTVKKVVKMLKKASGAHAGQAKDLEKAMTEEVIENFNMMIENGKSSQEISEKLGIDIVSVDKLIEAKNNGQNLHELGPLLGIGARLLAKGLAKGARVAAKNPKTAAATGLGGYVAKKASDVIKSYPDAAKIAGTAAALGAAGYGAKKAYDYFSNKKKTDKKEKN